MECIKASLTGVEERLESEIKEMENTDDYFNEGCYNRQMGNN